MQQKRQERRDRVRKVIDSWLPNYLHISRTDKTYTEESSKAFQLLHSGRQKLEYERLLEGIVWKKCCTGPKDLHYRSSYPNSSLKGKCKHEYMLNDCDVMIATVMWKKLSWYMQGDPMIFTKESCQEKLLVSTETHQTYSDPNRYSREIAEYNICHEIDDHFANFEDSEVKIMDLLRIVHDMKAKEIAEYRERERHRLTYKQESSTLFGLLSFRF